MSSDYDEEQTLLELAERVVSLLIEFNHKRVAPREVRTAVQSLWAQTHKRLGPLDDQS